MVKKVCKVKLTILLSFFSFIFGLSAEKNLFVIELNNSKLVIKGSHSKSVKFGKNCTLERKYVLKCEPGNEVIIVDKSRDLEVTGFSGEILIEDIRGNINLRCSTCNFKYSGKGFSGNIRVLKGNINIKAMKVFKNLIVKNDIGNIIVDIKNLNQHSLLFKTNYGDLKILKEELKRDIFYREKPIMQKILALEKSSRYKIMLLSTYGNIVIK